MNFSELFLETNPSAQQQKYDEAIAYLLGVDCQSQDLANFLRQLTNTRSTLRDRFFSALSTTDIRVFQQHYKEILIALDAELTTANLMIYWAIYEAHRHNPNTFNKKFVRYYPEGSLSLVPCSELAHIDWSRWSLNSVKVELLVAAGFQSVPPQNLVYTEIIPSPSPIFIGWCRISNLAFEGQVRTAMCHFSPYANDGKAIYPHWSAGTVHVAFDVRDAVLSAKRLFVRVSRYEVLPNISHPNEMEMAFHDRTLTACLSRFSRIDPHGAPSDNELAATIAGLDTPHVVNCESQQAQAVAVLNKLFSELENCLLPPLQIYQVENLLFAVALENVSVLGVTTHSLLRSILRRLTMRLGPHPCLRPVYTRLLTKYMESCMLFGSEAVVPHPLSTIYTSSFPITPEHLLCNGGPSSFF